jgi:hypothetical protein
MPQELQEAVFLIRTCKFFGCLPSQLENEDSSLLRMLALYDRGGFNEAPEDSEGGE